MQQELSQYLAELLYHHDRLSVPGLGTFELSHAPALVDQVQGQVSAPAKQIRFNANLVLDDGLLVDIIHREKGWSLSQSNRWLAEQVGEIKAALDRREIVELPGVGRFFRNFENQLQFVAENVNFNLDSFGLQAVPGQLVARSVSEKIPAIQSKVATPPPPPKAAKSASTFNGEWLRANLVWLIAGLMIVATFATFLLYPRSTDTEQPTVNGEAIAKVPQERLNASPTRVPDDETATTDTAADGSTDDTTTEPTAPEEDLDTEAATISPSEHTAVIAVGLFGNQDNVQRLLERLSKDGFSPISRPEGTNTRVGVNVRYSEERELQSVLREIRKDYASSAFIMTRDGREVNER